jgi:hypothetical protein
VGDGLDWLAASQLTIDGLTVSGSARQSVLIDGPVADGSSVARITLEGNDATLGILQQGLSPGGAQPEVGPDVPAIRTEPDRLFPIADGLDIPPEF